MHRIDTADSQVDSLTGETQFKDGPPGTKVDAAFLNAVQEEIVGVVEGALLQPTKGDNTQLLAAIRLIANFPVGAIIPYGGSTAPTGWLLGDGTAVSRTTYAALFAIYGTTYGVGDGVTTFNLPDLREAYVVGVGTRGAGVTAHDAFSLGQFKDDQAQGHIHSQTTGQGSGGFTSATPYTSAIPSSGSDDNTTAPETDGVNGTPRTGTVTRGKGFGLNYIIKY